ncbi:MAG: type IV-A pilus assembly ATPase PilB [Bdellovibrionota bacterium]
MAESLKDLLTKGGLSREQRKEAEAKAERENISLMHAIELLGYLDEKTVLSIFSTYYRIPKAYLDDMDVSRGILDLIPKELAVKFRVVPIDRAGNNIILAMGDPRNLQAIDTIRFSAGYFAKPVLASEIRITEAIEKYYGKVIDLKGLESETGSKSRVAQRTQDRKQIAGVKASKDDGPIIKIVNDVMIQCLRRGASDIHFEVYEETMRIRLRIDGSLIEIARPPLSMKGPLISRIKIMAGMNIAESRLPQDGAINIMIGDKPVDFRVNTLPTVYGEKIVMRILDKSNLQVDMTQLGFEEDQLKSFKSSILNPHGMVLVTGPTGSGKTTTLYSALQELNVEGSNIMTAEDPVEYNLSGINQVQMKSEIGLDFAAALRAFLRQDPDIIMVGEIRDLETAQIAIKAALTGHMVLSTLHTNSAPDTVSRLLNMGVEGFNLVSALSCITAQRLLKKICSRCRVIDESVTPDVLISLGIHPSHANKVQAYKGAGCSACGKSGTKGRVAVHEVLLMNEYVKKAILADASAMEIKEVAMQTGMRTLRQSAINKLAQGLASATEVVKVTSADSVKKPSSNRVVA